ncbi:MAG: TnsA endonuclease N-terminal domain-containing protein, partial [Promethearchaeota archaeon]
KEQGNRGFFPSNKVDASIVEYESGLERDLFLKANHAPNVKRIQHQPITIGYKASDGHIRKYTPDVYLEFQNGFKVLIEVKYASEVSSKELKYRERWDKAFEWGKKRGILFCVLTEKEIRTPRLHNIWFTLGASKSSSNDRYIPRLQSLIPKDGERYETLSILLAESEGITINKSAQIICYAIYHGLVFLETFSTHEITNQTLIRKKISNTSIPFSPLNEELYLPDIKITDSLEISQINEHEKIMEKSLGTLSFHIPEKYITIVNLRKKLVDLWLKQPRSHRTLEWRIDFCKKWKIGEKTIYTWVKAYREDGIEGLMPQYHKSGRKLNNQSDLAEPLEKARESYFKSQQTLNNAYCELEELCKKAQITPPNEASFRSYIYRMSTAVDFARKRGKKYFKSNFTPSLASFQGAYMPMQILQLDNTSFDVFPVDSEGREKLSTPYMTTAIDCYTRMITGFDISFFPSSGRTVLEVLVQSILPKHEYTELYDTESNWAIQGFPVLILVDNGMDYRAKDLKKFCMKYDIILEFVPIRTPRYKAFVEQWFNILRNALKDEKVHGYRPLLKERLENPSLKPEAEAVLSLQEIEDWVHKWVLDGYHLTNPYKGHVPAPILRWENFTAGQTDILLPLPREPPFKEEEIDLLYLSTLHHIERVLGYQGVVWEYLTYNNKELARMYNKIGKQNVSVLLNQRDVRSVWVVVPNEIMPIQVELGSGWAQAIAKIHGNRPIHASAWLKDVKYLRKRFKSQLSPLIYQKELSRLKRENLLAKAKKTTKTTRKEKEKMRETGRKSKIPPITSKSCSPEEEKDEEISVSKKKKIEIDYDNLPELWTDDFYSGDL